jgi:hypothetical protein
MIEYASIKFDQLFKSSLGLKASTHWSLPEFKSGSWEVFVGR